VTEERETSAAATWTVFVVLVIMLGTVGAWVAGFVAHSVWLWFDNGWNAWS